MSEEMSREQAIDELEILLNKLADCDTCKFKDRSWDEEPCDGCCENHNGYSALEAEPMRWIPVEKQPFPEEDGYYFVTYDNGEVGYEPFCGENWNHGGDNIIAWMLLPKPFRKESE